jgi:hypothetical protein
MIPKLYKYLPPKRISYLKDQLLRGTQPNALNDPFEFQPSFTEEMLDQAKKNLGKDDVSIDFNEFAHEYLSKGGELINNELGIVSLSRNKSNIMMWSHYCRGHSGFCVGFDFSTDFPLEQRNDLDKLFRKVEYKSERVNAPISPNDKVPIELTHRKSVQWEYEEETRLIFDLKKANKIITKEHEKLCFFEISHEFISDITIGINADSRTKNEIVDFCKLNNIDCYLSTIHPSKYELDFKMEFQSIK